MTNLYGNEMKDFIFQSAFEFDQKEVLHYKVYDFFAKKPKNHELSHKNLNIEEHILKTFV